MRSPMRVPPSGMFGTAAATRADVYRQFEQSTVYGIFQPMSTDRLTSTSYLILGMLAREGPSTPYALERDVAATLGNFWSFPHALLYKEPPRLEAMGLVTETREPAGRRRRVLAITPAGRAALTTWLDRPARAHTEL